MSDEFWRSVLDPSAPLPSGWPVGALGAFLLFCVPLGGGIPAGGLWARAGGVSPPGMAVLYFLSDVVLALTFEPVLRVLAWIGRWIPLVRRLGARVARFATRTGGAGTGVRGPLGL